MVKPKNVINIVERPSQIMNSAQFSRLYLNICAGWTTLFCAMKRKAGNILLSKNFAKSKNFFCDFVLEINFLMMGQIFFLKIFFVLPYIYVFENFINKKVNFVRTLLKSFFQLGHRAPTLKRASKSVVRLRSQHLPMSTIGHRQTDYYYQHYVTAETNMFVDCKIPPQQSSQ